MLSLNWHFNPNGVFRPYIGAGVNYTMFSGEETRGALAGNNLKLDDWIGAAGQVGVDIGQRNWFFNANVRYIDLSTDVDSMASTWAPRPEPVGVRYPRRLSLRPHGPAGPGCRAGRCAAAPAAAPARQVRGHGWRRRLRRSRQVPGHPGRHEGRLGRLPAEQTLKLLFDFDSAELRPSRSRNSSAS